MKSISLFFWSFLILGSFGCMRTINVSMRHPDALELPKQIDSWVLLDHSQAAPPEVRAPRLRSDDQIVDRFEQPSLIILEGVIKYLESNSHTPSVVPAHLQLPFKFGEEPVLPPRSIQFLCKEYGAEGLIELSELLPIWDTVTTRETDDWGELLYTVEVRLSCMYSFRLYDAVAQQLDEFNGVFREKWMAEGESEILAWENLPRMSEVKQAIYPFIGATYGQILSPPNLVVERKYYPQKVGPTHEIASLMEKAAALAAEDRWIEAARIWRPIAEKPRLGKVAGRAAYNLALACESNGDLDAAKRWLLIAQNRYRVWGSGKYLDLLLAQTGAG